MSYNLQPSNATVDSSGTVHLTVSPPPGDNSTKAATTAFVKNAFSNPYTPSAVAITGGAINNTPVGATTASSGAFSNATIATLTAPSAAVSGTLTVSGWVRKVRTVTSGATITMLSTDDVLIVNKNPGSATAVTLPASPAFGMRVVVKDARGDANTNNITISPAAGTIDGAATFLINAAYGFGDFVYDGTQWSAFTAGGTTVAQSESPEGTAIFAPDITSIITASNVTGQADPGPTFNTFQLTSGGAISMNGGAATGGNVVSLYYHSHGCFQHATDNSTFNAWWYWDTTLATPGWTLYEVSAVSLSGTTYAQNATANTVIGTITVTMANTQVLSAFSGTLSVSDTTNFKIVGTQLQANTTLTQASYSITLTATPNPVGQPFTTTTISLTQTGTQSAIAYATSSTTTPLTAGFPSPLPNSAAYTNPPGGGTASSSPLGWTVSFFDDFNGTFTRSGSFLTTGALYNGSLARYWSSATYGGYLGTYDFSLITMSNSSLVLTAQWISGGPHVTAVIMQFPTPWGFWEWSSKMTTQADGLHNSIDYGLWLSGPQWPASGEYDTIETLVGGAFGSGGGIQTIIHMGTAANSDNRRTNLTSSSSLPGGGSWFDGNFHVYGTIITPCYVGTYVNGLLQAWTNSTTLLNNLSTTSDPPFASAAGSFGYLANTMTLNPASTSVNGNLCWTMILGPGGCGNPSSGYVTPYQAAFPCTQSIDWFRHSKLFPATGGPHV